MTKSASSPKTPPVGASPVSVTSVTHFIEEVTAYADNEPLLKRYRGQRDSGWDNIPGLFRPDLLQLEQNEKRATRDLISVHPAEFATDQTMFDKLVRMQHFGLPTRLMDVSLNPLVALYFATDPASGSASEGRVTAFAIPSEREKYFDSDAVSCLANLANMTAAEKQELTGIRGGKVKGSTKQEEIDRINAIEVIQRLHQFIKVEKPHFLSIINPIDLFKPYYVHPKMSNRRILSQAGGFIIHGLQPPKPIKFAKVITPTHFVIAASEKAGIRKSLDLLGINESTLFPEIDKAAKRIMDSYLA